LGTCGLKAVGSWRDTWQIEVEDALGEVCGSGVLGVPVGQGEEQSCSQGEFCTPKLPQVAGGFGNKAINVWNGCGSEKHRRWPGRALMARDAVSGERRAAAPVSDDDP